MQFDLVAEGLLFPEGPVVLEDGTVLVVEIAGESLTRVRPDGRKDRVAALPGGPNGAALGPDGLVYICNNGGMSWRAEDGGLAPAGVTPTSYTTGRLERVDLATGQVERLFDSWNGEPLRAPNDLVFDRAGGLWFTDFGKNLNGHRTPTALYYMSAGGSTLHRRFQAPHSFNEIGPNPAKTAHSFNGIGLSPDETALFVADTHGARMLRFDLTGPGALAPGEPQELCAIGGERGFDSLAVGAGGEIYVGGLNPGAIFVVQTSGETRELPLPDPYVTNLCFGGPQGSAFITFSQSGRLVRSTDLGPGLPLNFAAAPR